jgi:hypothetical protein
MFLATSLAVGPAAVLQRIDTGHRRPRVAGASRDLTAAAIRSNVGQPRVVDRAPNALSTTALRSSPRCCSGRRSEIT